MWGDKQPQTATPVAPAKPVTPATPIAVRSESPASPSIPAAAILTSPRTTAWLGSNLRVKGDISGDEDLRVDGKVEGPISIGGHPRRRLGA